MKFLVDVNIPQSVINTLSNLGHNVKDSKEGLLESPDTDLIKVAKKEKRIILTRDKDFIVLAQFPKYQAATIVIRLKDQKPRNILRYLTELLANQREDLLKNSLTILTEESADSYQLTLAGRSE